MNATGCDGWSAAWKIVGLTESIWIANPMFSAWFAPAELIPTTCPPMFKSGPPEVPGVYGRIGLGHVVVDAGLVCATLRYRTSRVLDVDLPRQRGDDPSGHRGPALEAEGVSNRDDALPE